MFKSDRKIMYPSDIDRLISLIKICVIAKDILDNNAYQETKNNLAEFIVSLDVEILDLISRGRSDDSVREYTQVNSRFMPYTE